VKVQCKDLRDGLIAGSAAPLPSEWLDHLRECPTCERYRTRLLAVRGFLREHRTEVDPDPAFAARVAARLPASREDALGWAALRLIPATLALALALGWFALRTAPVWTAADDPAPTEDLLSWVLETTETER